MVGRRATNKAIAWAEAGVAAIAGAGSGSGVGAGTGAWYGVLIMKYAKFSLIRPIILKNPMLDI